MNSPSLIVPFKLLAALCVSLTGLGSWIVVNGLWYEIPLLVNVLPESWNLPAYLSVFIQIANIGPLLYVPLTKLCRRQFSGRFRCLSQCLQPPERLANYVILSVGFVSCILLANFWNVVLPLPGLSNSGGHSVILLALALSAATVDCISTITFIAYLTGMPSAYVAALSFGEALSDLLPSSLALVQGIGETVQCVNQTVNGTNHIFPVFAPPRFPVTVFLYGLSAILAVSLTAFTLLDTSKFGLGYYVTRNFQRSLEEKLATERSPSGDLRKVERQLSGAAKVDLQPTLVQLVVPILLLCYASMLSFGFLPALQSYSSAAYSQLTFHLSVNLSGLATALLAVLITWLVYRQRHRQGDLVSSPSSSDFPVSTALGSEDNTMMPSAAVLTVNSLSCSTIHRPYWAAELNRARPYWLLLSGFLLLPTGHIIYLAASSPSPPHLAGLGPVLAVVSWILIRAGFSGLRTWLWLFLTNHCHDSMVIRIAGLLSQIGSAVGAVISFLLVVHYQIFVIKSPC